MYVISISLWELADPSAIKKGFSRNRQEDTHEFFRFVTDALQNEALFGLPKYAST